ncbi:uncharacterized protein LOC126551204 [Aphis gossypii]|uniref:uncharacterized protein LOC126551204 n=1 Tax=Aphis gossypii TaxID=80765 RepID=UPI0021590536|nr:uncharacterized protein LOC126551204 [Aphis gossypii]
MTFFLILLSHMHNRIQLRTRYSTAFTSVGKRPTDSVIHSRYIIIYLMKHYTYIMSKVKIPTGRAKRLVYYGHKYWSTTLRFRGLSVGGHRGLRHTMTDVVYVSPSWHFITTICIQYYNVQYEC